MSLLLDEPQMSFHGLNLHSQVANTLDLAIVAVCNGLLKVRNSGHPAGHSPALLAAEIVRRRRQGGAYCASPTKLGCFRPVHYMRVTHPLLDYVCVSSGKMLVLPPWPWPRGWVTPRCGFEPMVAVTVAAAVAKVAAKVASAWAREAVYQHFLAVDKLVIRCQRGARRVLAVAAEKRERAQRDGTQAGSLAHGSGGSFLTTRALYGCGSGDGASPPPLPEGDIEVPTEARGEEAHSGIEVPTEARGEEAHSGAGGGHDGSDGTWVPIEARVHDGSDGTNVPVEARGRQVAAQVVRRVARRWLRSAGAARVLQRAAGLIVPYRHVKSREIT